MIYLLLISYLNLISILRFLLLLYLFNVGEGCQSLKLCGEWWVWSVVRFVATCYKFYIIIEENFKFHE